MSQTQGKILIIRGGAIGDFILTLPVLAALRQQFPHTQLEALAYRHIAQLAVAGGLADRVQSIEARALAGFFARNGSLDSALGEYFADFAVVISYLYDPDEIFRTNLARCSKAQFIAGLHRPDEKLNIHATDVFLKPLERLAIFGSDPVPRLRIPAKDSSPILFGKAQYPPAGVPTPTPVAELRVALHPGSGSEKKNWPEAKWSELIEHLAARTNWCCLLVGGEAEGERLDRLAGLMPAGRLERAQSLPLVDVAIWLQQCHFFIGHDSGISHLAAAVGLSSLVLWGETNPAIWRPRGDHVTILRSQKGLMRLEVESVLEALLRLRGAVSQPGRPASLRTG